MLYVGYRLMPFASRNKPADGRKRTIGNINIAAYRRLADIYFDRKYEISLMKLFAYESRQHFIRQLMAVASLFLFGLLRRWADNI